MEDDRTVADSTWAKRSREWRIRLRRLPLDQIAVEPAIARHRATTILLTSVAGGVGLFVAVLITGFGRADVGAVAGLLLAAPILVVGWWDHVRLACEARQYELERCRFEPFDLTLPAASGE
jgi:hypothetical protein